jgi:tetratricopeptide (TPR) repeat protein
MGLGFWMIEKKTDLTRSENQPDTGLWAIYSALGMIFCLGVALSFGLANDLMWEVLEDAITLIHFCMGMSFFLYVLINFFQLMGMGLRVHLVVFKPRYMPVAGIPVFGLGAVVLFLINEGYFPYYQALSAREVLLADHSRLAGDRFLAENHLKAALSLEYRNQRTNLSLAGLYYEMGNVEKGRQFAEASLEKRPCPEAYLAMAQVHRRRGNTLEEILQLQEGIRKFPNDGRLLNNLGMAFNESVYTDSALTYFARAAETNAGAQAGKTNLGFFYLVHKLEKDGLPQKSPESDAWGDWAQMNNNMVFANVAGETSASLGDVQRKFADIPAEIQPFVLFHAYINKAITKDSTDAGALKKLENDSLIKYYSNALDMGRALLHYRTGQTHKGMDEMLHLFQRSNDRKLDLALLLGQVYYDQGAYESAALFFKQAAGMGMPKAMYWYALSSLDAGRKNEAIEAFRESIPHLSPSDRIRVSVLVDGLASGKFQNAAQRSDPEKSAYIKVFWNNLKDDQITDLIGRTSDKESQRFLWKYCFDRAYREGMASRCQELHYYGQKHFGKNALWIVQLGATRPLMLEITGKLDVLEKTTDPDFLKKFPFLQARLNQKKGDKAKARISFLEALELQPLHTRQIGYALSYLFQEMGNKDEAYQKALEFSDLDPSNVELLKLYALFSVRMGLPEFAYPVVNRIEVLTNAEVAGAFRQKINQEVAAKNYYTPPLLP